MKITFNRQEISTAVNPLMNAVAGKSTLAAIEGILIKTIDQNTCMLTTFDLEKGMQIKINAQVEEEGCFIINAQKFYQTLKVMEGEEITLTVNDKMLAEISCGKSSHKMVALNGQDFPEIPKLTSQNGFVVSQKIFRDMLQKTSFAMGVNDARAVLNGCFVKVGNDRIEVVSCDSFKMAKCSAGAELENIGEEKLDFEFIIPTKTVNELCRLLSDDEEEKATIYMSHKNIVIVLGDLTFFSRLITGDYIDYNRFIIKTHKITVKADRLAFISALERAALITEERIAGSVRSYVKLEISQGIMKILATSTAGSTYDELPVDMEGGDIVIAFSNRYLIDTLRSCTADTVLISMTSPLASINIEPDGDDAEDEFFMLLPVRMKE